MTYQITLINPRYWALCHYDVLKAMGDMNLPGNWEASSVFVMRLGVSKYVAYATIGEGTFVDGPYIMREKRYTVEPATQWASVVQPFYAKCTNTLESQSLKRLTQELITYEIEPVTRGAFLSEWEIQIRSSDDPMLYQKVFRGLIGHGEIAFEEIIDDNSGGAGEASGIPISGHGNNWAATE